MPCSPYPIFLSFPKVFSPLFPLTFEFDKLHGREKSNQAVLVVASVKLMLADFLPTILPSDNSGFDV